jgi:hypothetical protein
MSPRSEEFMDQAKERAIAAQELLEAGAGDYEAVTPDPAEARKIVEAAAIFAAVEQMLDA